MLRRSRRGARRRKSRSILVHAAIAADDRFKANMHLLSGYLENKLYFLKLYEGIVMELKAELENALGDAAPVTTSQERSRLR